MARDIEWLPSVPRLPAPPVAVQSGWQCPVCKRCYAPSVAMCSHCPAGPVTGTADITITSVGDPPGSLGGGSITTRVNYGYGNPCPRPREGGLCGCDEDEPDGPQDCYRTRCSC